MITFMSVFAILGVFLHLLLINLLFITNNSAVNQLFYTHGV